MFRISVPTRRLLLVGPLALLAATVAPRDASSQAYRDYTGLTTEQIVQTETSLLGSYTRELLPQCTDRATALEAVTSLLSERDIITVSLNRVYPIDQLEGIGVADAIDDSLARDFALLARQYVKAAGPASYPDTAGALATFRDRISLSPGVGDVPVPYATVAAVKFGSDALLAARETGTNIEAAEDAFLRYVDDLGTAYLDARTTLLKRHEAEVRNEDWVLARLRCPECGAHDWDVGPLFMKIKKGTSNYYHTRDLTCRHCGKVITWDYFLPSFTIMNRIHSDTLPGEPRDTLSTAKEAPTPGRTSASPGPEGSSGQ